MKPKYYIRYYCIDNYDYPDSSIFSHFGLAYRKSIYELSCIPTGQLIRKIAINNIIIYDTNMNKENLVQLDFPFPIYEGYKIVKDICGNSHDVYW